MDSRQEIDGLAAGYGVSSLRARHGGGQLRTVAKVAVRVLMVVVDEAPGISFCTKRHVLKVLASRQLALMIAGVIPCVSLPLCFMHIILL